MLKCGYITDPTVECDGEVKERKTMTAYVWDGEGEDPNYIPPMCESHWKEYYDHWSEMWAEYNAGRI